MELKRRIALAAALVAVGLGAGHIVQKRDAEERLAAAEPELAVDPASIQPLAAEADPPALSPEAAPALPAAPILAAPEPAAPVVESAEACPVTLDLGARENAMLGLTLAAPCHADERVVVKHGGLAVTGHLSATGTLFLDLPAMTAEGVVDVIFPDGTLADAAQPMPEVAMLRRVAVQWLDRDRFQLHAFENGADYGQPGHVSAATPQTPAPGFGAKAGYLTRIGDDTVRLPMLAEIYTFPASGPAEIAIEAAVSPETCGRELLGETVASLGGKVATSELTLAMPDCAALGDILVLKNPVPEMKLAGR